MIKWNSLLVEERTGKRQHDPFHLTKESKTSSPKLLEELTMTRISTIYVLSGTLAPLVRLLTIIGTCSAFVCALSTTTAALEINTPHINVPTPHINVPTPHVNVPTPHVNVPTPHVTAPSGGMQLQLNGQQPTNPAGVVTTRTVTYPGVYLQELSGENHSIAGVSAVTPTYPGVVETLQGRHPSLMQNGGNLHTPPATGTSGLSDDGAAERAFEYGQQAQYDSGQAGSPKGPRTHPVEAAVSSYGALGIPIDHTVGIGSPPISNSSNADALLQAAEQMQETQMEFNMHYLQLQENKQGEIQR
jgi:hypothetical protein